ncbi:MAG: 30S ribosomal protein S8 [Candidatus Woesearchaeota archaeon]|jgi:small subunit ribosomal protein S8|nr:30S ribosomal protein S8 [Candidatus Woesearchaeota archaeon]MDP7181772.1 30S ribosomal protein S8 [Candidatus Woesearchaeota archaeon]MDP7198861.1 30S ribosomal protein S8 [Candidatus Woesearchaeota archaeon]MDP7467139.1 30S ribosomal protein S8 [Candidatus Woesearchaeota archaeon]MDP7647526.1 30S ribosomal protein S8 [Candidatus Woesearchaeota archaeon]|tara:strand:+ start:42 stop:431 length:390 start_codon:yes stop_codon:yes gene_type:complete
MLNDTLANGLSIVQQNDKQGKRDCNVQPASKTTKRVLEVLNEEGYIGQAEEAYAARGGQLKVHLLGTINKIGVIKPRFAVKISDFEKFEKRYLPAKGMGVLIISTSQGIMTHEAAKEKKIGGRLIAYCY